MDNVLNDCKFKVENNKIKIIFPDWLNYLTNVDSRYDSKGSQGTDGSNSTIIIIISSVLVVLFLILILVFVLKR